MSLKHVINDARTYLDPQAVDCVVYHHPCPDGTGAALSAWLARGDTVTYMQRDYTKPFDESALKGKNVILLDTAFSPEELHRVRQIAKKVAILDHHDSAEKSLSGEPGCFFNMRNSGAILAWHYFNGMDKPAPRILQLIEDRDLWRWNEREHSEPLYYALMDKHPMPDFKEYAAYVEIPALNTLIQHGTGILARTKQWCAEMADKALMRRFTPPGSTTDYLVMCLELADNKYVSELAETIYNRYPLDLVMLWYPLANGSYKVSFRNNVTTLNVADIATIFDGGGHPRAAGAVMYASPWSYLEELKNQQE